MVQDLLDVVDVPVGVSRNGDHVLRPEIDSLDVVDDRDVRPVEVPDQGDGDGDEGEDGQGGQHGLEARFHLMRLALNGLG